MIRAILLSLALLPGCAGFLPQATPIPVSQTLSAEAQGAQKVINEGYVLLIAVANTTASYLDQGFLTKAEGRVYYLKLKDAQDKLALAQRMLDEGLAVLAGDKAKIAKTIADALHEELAQRKVAK